MCNLDWIHTIRTSSLKSNSHMFLYAELVALYIQCGSLCERCPPRNLMPVYAVYHSSLWSIHQEIQKQIRYLYDSINYFINNSVCLARIFSTIRIDRCDLYNTSPVLRSSKSSICDLRIFSAHTHSSLKSKTSIISL